MRHKGFEVFSKKVQAYSIHTREHREWKRRGRGIVMEAQYDFSQGKRGRSHFNSARWSNIGTFVLNLAHVLDLSS